MCTGLVSQRFNKRFGSGGALVADALALVAEDHKEWLFRRPQPVKARNREDNGREHDRARNERNPPLGLRKIRKADSEEPVHHQQGWNEQQQKPRTSELKRQNRCRHARTLL